MRNKAKKDYYRVKGKAWHWMPTCSQWPIDNYEIENSRSNNARLCSECQIRARRLLKERVDEQ
jgi:hypothetical protein